MPESALPPEFESLFRLVDAQEPNVRELFQYALALLLVEDGKAEIIERRTVSMREQLTVRTVAGDTFTLVKPDVHAELLAQMQEMVREVLADEHGRADSAVGRAAAGAACSGIAAHFAARFYALSSAHLTVIRRKACY